MNYFCKPIARIKQVFIYSLVLGLALTSVPVSVFAQAEDQASSVVVPEVNTPSEADGALLDTETGPLGDALPNSIEQQEPILKKPKSEIEELPLEEIETFSLSAAQPGSIPDPTPDPNDVDKGLSTIKSPIPKADVASGALTYDVPIAAPPGRLGMEPSVSLSYSSLNSDRGSVYGYGWELTLPKISRKNINGLDKIFDGRDFTTSVTGDLVEINTGEFVARVDTGQNLLFRFLTGVTGDYWEVLDKQGVQYVYGQDPSARLANQQNAAKISEWYLTQVVDSNGNSVNYNYVLIDGKSYLDSVSYTNHAAQPGIFSLQFEYELRRDVYQNASVGFLSKTTQRLSKVSSLVQSVLVYETVLSYEQQAINNESLLSSVEVVGYDDQGQTTSDGPLQMSYQSIAATSLLSDLVLPTGGTLQVSYLPSAAVVDMAAGQRNPALPYNFYVIDTINYSDPAGLTWQNRFEYYGGAYYYDNPFDKRVAGFEQVKQFDHQGNSTVTYYHQGSGDNVTFGETGDAFAKIGRSYKTEYLSNTEALFIRVVNTWEQSIVDSGSGAQRVLLQNSLTQDFDGNTNYKSSAVEYVYDNHANTTAVRQLGEVDSSEDGSSYTDILDDAITTNYFYAGPIDQLVRLIGAPYKVELEDYDGALQSKAVTLFDSLPEGQIDAGNVTTQRAWIVGSQYAEATYTYNQFGLVLTETDPVGNPTTVVYDNFKMYPVSSINALGYASTIVPQYTFGVEQRTVSPNGLVSETDYDGLGRVVATRVSDPNSVNPSVLTTTSKAEYGWREENGERHGREVTETRYFGAADPAENLESKTVTYNDGFDRPVQVRTQAESLPGATEERYRVTDTNYNKIAQVDRISLPYFSNGHGFTTATTQQELYQSFEYDAMYRLAKTQNTLGVEAKSYDQWRETTTDILGNQKELRFDGQGRLMQVTEYNNSEQYQTNYKYDSLGSLVQLIDALGNVRNIEYDGLGRRTAVEDLHDPADSSFGVWQYSYDDADNLIDQSNPNGEFITYQYDQLNRVLVELVDGDPYATYNYDSCTNGIVLLCSVTTDQISEQYQYDSHGNPVQITKSINGEQFVTKHSFDVIGNSLVIENPDGSKVAYTYNLGGNLEAVQASNDKRSSLHDVITNFDYGPHGRITKQVHANGNETVSDYDEQALYRLVNKTTTSNGGVKLQDLSYTYDLVGNITSITDQGSTASSRVSNYSYDNLYRLIDVSVTESGGGFARSYEYDAIGNITYQSDLGSYQYEGHVGSSMANPHAVTSIEKDGDSSAFSYDDNGNMLTRAGGYESVQAYTWNHRNQMTSVTVDGGRKSYSYVYDESGIRSGVSTGSRRKVKWTYYPSAFYNEGGENGTVKHILAGGQQLGTITSEKRSVVETALHVDHLSSVSVIADMNGQVVEHSDYFPYGAVRDSQLLDGSAEQRQFLGREYDRYSELSYLQARYYDGATGRFVRQDPLHLAWGNPGAMESITGMPFESFLADPQSFNSYSYARNNPINLSDPDGESWLRDKWEEGKARLERRRQQAKLAWNVVNGVGSSAYNAVQRRISEIITPDYSKGSSQYTQKQEEYLSQGAVYAGTYSGRDIAIGVAASPIASTATVATSEVARVFSVGVKNQKLQNIINDFYKPGDMIPGGTAGAIRNELKTGLQTGNRWHSEKGQNLLNGLNKLLRSNSLNQNEYTKAQILRRELNNALDGK